MNEVIKTIKQIHSNDVCLFRMGGFFHTYGNDSYILSYFFGYKIRDLGNNVFECGFPVDIIPRIMKKLEDNKINYIVLDRRNNYNVEEKANYKNLNRYERFAKKARIYVNSKKKIDDISNYLTKNIYAEDMKDIIYNIEKYLEKREDKLNKKSKEFKKVVI